MSIDINLVSKTSESSKEARLRKIKTFSFVTLFVVGFLSIAFFLINYRFSANYVRKEQIEIMNSLSEYENIASKIFLLNKRLSDISLILSTRKKHHERAGKIIEKIPSSTQVSEFQIDDSGIVMEVSSGSLIELNNFLNDLLSLSESKVLNGVLLDGLSTSKSEFIMKVKAN